jgi:hypothetical protein
VVAVLECYVFPTIFVLGSPEDHQLRRLIRSGKHLDTLFQRTVHGEPATFPPRPEVERWVRAADRAAEPYYTIASAAPGLLSERDHVPIEERWDWSE